MGPKKKEARDVTPGPEQSKLSVDPMLQQAQPDAQRPQEALVRVPSGAGFDLAIPDPTQWSHIIDFCDKLIKTGMLPDKIDKPEKAALVLLKGREVGLPPVMALTEVFVVKGKASMSTMAYGYLLTKAGIKVDFPVHTPVKATCRLTRPDGRWYEQTFTMEDAGRMYTSDGSGESRKTIRLSESLHYRANPEEMMMNRAESRAAKRFCPDVVGGAGLMDEVNDVDAIDVPAQQIGMPRGPIEAMPDLGKTLTDRLSGAAPPPAAAPPAPEPTQAAPAASVGAATQPPVGRLF